MVHNSLISSAGPRRQFVDGGSLSLDILIILPNLVMWTLLPLLHFDTRVAMTISIATCIWRPFTCIFLIGLSETMYQEGAFRDILLTPGRMVMGALAIRAALRPARVFALWRDLPVWLKGGFLIYCVPLLINAAYRNQPTMGYAAVANIASALAIGVIARRYPFPKRLMQALLLGLMPCVIYYYMVVLGIMEPIREFTPQVGYMIAAGRLNPNDAAISMVLLILVAVFLLCETRERFWRYLSLATIFVTIAVLPITGSRGGLLALICGLGVAAIGAPGKILRNSLLGILSGLMILVVATMFIPELHDAFGTIQTMTERSIESAWEEMQQPTYESPRKTLWRGAVQRLSDTPLLPDYAEYRNQFSLMTHNTFLEIAMQGGIIAVIGTLMLWVGGSLTSLKLVRRYRMRSGMLFFLSALAARFVSANVTAIVSDKIFYLLCVYVAVLSTTPAWCFGSGIPPRAHAPRHPEKDEYEGESEEEDEYNSGDATDKDEDPDLAPEQAPEPNMFAPEKGMPT